MDSKEVFLTKDILGNLSLRVAKTLPCLKSLNDSTIWDKPIELCKRIEENVREIDNVILEVRKENGYYQNNSGNPLIFQVLLARVYILLYYRHTDEELYKAMVFPVLQENMGIYSEKLLNDIQSKVKKVQEIDNLIEESRQEKKKICNPKYSLICLSSGEADEYFTEFSNEKLFRGACRNLENMKEHYFRAFDVATIWLTAKDVVQKLWQEKSPENFIDRIYHKLSLSGNTRYVETGAAEAVILCAYMMMRSVKKSDHFHKAIAYIERIPNKQSDYHLLHDEIGYGKRYIDNGSIVYDDYDYTGGIQQTVETYTKADVERILQNKNNQIDQLRMAADKVTVLEQEKDQLGAEKARLYAENEQLKEQVKQLEDATTETPQQQLETELMNSIENIPRLKLLWQLMKLDGAEVEHRNNQKIAMQIMQAVTGIPFDSCKKIWGRENAPIKRQQELIVRLNTWMKSIGMNIQL